MLYGLDTVAVEQVVIAALLSPEPMQMLRRLSLCRSVVRGGRHVHYSTPGTFHSRAKMIRPYVVGVVMVVVMIVVVVAG